MMGSQTFSLWKLSAVEVLGTKGGATPSQKRRLSSQGWEKKLVGILNWPGRLPGKGSLEKGGISYPST